MKLMKKIMLYVAVLLLASGCTKKEDPPQMKPVEEPAVRPQVTIDLSRNDLQTAKRINNEGFLLYQRRQFEAAMHKFIQAYNADDTYYYAHYNYACVLGILKGMYPDRYPDAEKEAFLHLRKTLMLDPAHFHKMISDPDLAVFRNNPDYMVLVAEYRQIAPPAKSNQNSRIPQNEEDTF